MDVIFSKTNIYTKYLSCVNYGCNFFKINYLHEVSKLCKNQSEAAWGCPFQKNHLQTYYLQDFASWGARCRKITCRHTTHKISKSLERHVNDD
jgi:hypothetical protein